jgi:RHS repeat-associated protein
VGCLNQVPSWPLPKVRDQYQHNVTGSSATGALTWNADGTLKQLVITNPFNTAGSQTCNDSYDDLSRLASANCGAIWGQSFGYDPFGNLTKSVLPGSAGNSFQPTYNPATNRFSSIPGTTPAYDSNGNVTGDGSHSYAWDAEGRPITLDGIGITYDALLRMVEQNRSGAYTQIVYAPTGEKLALMNGQTLVKAFVPLPGAVTAVYTASGLDHYRHPDWLGSNRLTSTPSRTVSSTVAYAPFGETYAQSGAADLSFTGQNSDTSGGDYDFLFREYSTQGRWASPDPAGLMAVSLDIPQSWNRYAYVLNNPLSFIDPAGLFCAWDDHTRDDEPENGGATRLECLAQGGEWVDTSGPGGCDGPCGGGGGSSGVDPCALPGSCGGGGSGSCPPPLVCSGDSSGQAPQIGPQPTLTFKPPSWQNFTHDFLPCYGAQLIDNFVGNKGKAAVTAGTVALTAKNPLLGGSLLVVWTGINAFKAGAACAVASRAVYK